MRLMSGEGVDVRGLAFPSFCMWREGQGVRREPAYKGRTNLSLV